MQNNKIREQFIHSLREGAELRLQLMKTCEDSIFQAADAICRSLENGRKVLLFGNGGWSEGFFVRFADDGGLVVFVCLPENDADLVVGEIFAPENLHLVVGVPLSPAVEVTLFNPPAVCVSHAIAFAREGFWFFLELLVHFSRWVKPPFLPLQQIYMRPRRRFTKL